MIINDPRHSHSIKNMITDCCAGVEFDSGIFNGQICEEVFLAHILKEIAHCWRQQCGIHGATLQPEVSRTYFKKIDLCAHI
ncbi:rCG39936 [Rattus norvegicus]|uniref:RCG39936 n=1 Tax=Rattus norvegicus TaxID=10116 RepID=A6I7R7_RAT|nr:rCG39936 [Rattus norvegicus]